MKYFLLLAVFLTAHSTAFAGFEQEPNGSTSTANEIILNETYTGRAYEYDHDYFVFNVSEGTDLIINIQNTTANSGVTYYTIYENDRSKLREFSVSSYDTDKHTYTQGVRPGTYFFTVYNSRSSYHDYEFSIISKLNQPRPVTIPSVVGTTGINDLNFNGSSETAVLKIQGDTKGIVKVIDSRTKATIKKFVVSSDSRIKQPISITSYSDVNGDGIADLGILLLNRTTGKYIQQIRNAKTGKVLKSFQI